MAITAGKKTADYGSLAFAASTVGLVMLATSIAPISYPKLQIDRCPFDSAGKVIPDRTADGVLTLAARIYFVHRAGVDDSVVAAYRGRGTSSALLRVVERHVGEDTHIEYCGRTVTGITASGMKVYEVRPDTQAKMNGRADSERRLGLNMGAGWLILGLLCFLRRRFLKRAVDRTIG